MQRYIEFLLDMGIIGGQIGVVGFSPDAVVTLMMASEESELAWIVLDIPFPDLGQVVCLKVSRIRVLPGFSVPGIMHMGRILLELTWPWCVLWK